MGNIKYTIRLASGDVISSLRQQGDRYVDALTNFEEIKNLINGPVLRPRFRIFILNEDETIREQIPNSDILEGGSYSENYQSGQRRSLSFSLVNDEGQYLPNINNMWAETKFRLELGLEADNGDIIWFQHGVYVVNSANPSLSADSKTVSISANDKFGNLEGNLGKLDSTYEIPAGVEIKGVIEDLLLTTKGNGSPIDPQPIIYPSAFEGKKTQATITKSAGETIGSIILDLATQLSAEVFYNSVGRLTFVPMVETKSDFNKPILYDLVAEKGDMTGLDFSIDYNNIINRIIVIGTTSSGYTYRGEAKNTNPASPICVGRVGNRTEVVNDSNIYSKILAEERAEYELRQKSIIASSTSLNISFNPLLSVDNLVTVTSDFYGLIQDRFVIQSVSCGLGYDGSMSISVTNLNDLPFTTGGSQLTSAKQDMTYTINGQNFKN